MSHHGAQLRWKGQLGGGEGLIPTHPVNIPCGRKPEHPEKTHDFRQSVDRLFSHESVARIEPTHSEVQGPCSDDCATEAPKAAMEFYQFHSVLCIHAFLGVSSRLLSVFCNRFLLCLLYDGGNEKNWDSLLLHQSILYTESIITAPTF